eukprot:1651135-Prymnesium_polylepis.1
MSCRPTCRRRADRSATRRVLNWLSGDAGVTIEGTHPHGRFIRASAAVSVWERMLDTLFVRFIPACQGADCAGAGRRLAEAASAGVPCVTKDVKTPSDVHAVQGTGCPI